MTNGLSFNGSSGLVSSREKNNYRMITGEKAQVFLFQKESGGESSNQRSHLHRRTGKTSFYQKTHRKTSGPQEAWHNTSIACGVVFLILTLFLFPFVVVDAQLVQQQPQGTRRSTTSRQASFYVGTQSSNTSPQKNLHQDENPTYRVLQQSEDPPKEDESSTYLDPSCYRSELFESDSEAENQRVRPVAGLIFYLGSKTKPLTIEGMEISVNGDLKSVTYDWRIRVYVSEGTYSEQAWDAPSLNFTKIADTTALLHPDQQRVIIPAHTFQPLPLEMLQRRIFYIRAAGPWLKYTTDVFTKSKEQAFSDHPLVSLFAGNPMLMSETPSSSSSFSMSFDDPTQEFPTELDTAVASIFSGRLHLTVERDVCAEKGNGEGSNYVPPPQKTETTFEFLHVVNETLAAADYRNIQDAVNVQVDDLLLSDPTLSLLANTSNVRMPFSSKALYRILQGKCVVPTWAICQFLVVQLSIEHDDTISPGLIRSQFFAHAKPKFFEQAVVPNIPNATGVEYLGLSTVQAKFQLTLHGVLAGQELDEYQLDFVARQVIDFLNANLPALYSQVFTIQVERQEFVPSTRTRGRRHTMMLERENVLDRTLEGVPPNPGSLQLSGTLTGGNIVVEPATEFAKRIDQILADPAKVKTLLSSLQYNANLPGLMLRDNRYQSFTQLQSMESSVDEVISMGPGQGAAIGSTQEQNEESPIMATAWWCIAGSLVLLLICVLAAVWVVIRKFRQYKQFGKTKQLKKTKIAPPEQHPAAGRRAQHFNLDDQLAHVNCPGGMQLLPAQRNTNASLLPDSQYLELFHDEAESKPPQEIRFSPYAIQHISEEDSTDGDNKKKNRSKRNGPMKSNSMTSLDTTVAESMDSASQCTEEATLGSPMTASKAQTQPRRGRKRSSSGSSAPVAPVQSRSSSSSKDITRVQTSAPASPHSDASGAPSQHPPFVPVTTGPPLQSCPPLQSYSNSKKTASLQNMVPTTPLSVVPGAQCRQQHIAPLPMAPIPSSQSLSNSMRTPRSQNNGHTARSVTFELSSQQHPTQTRVPPRPTSQSVADSNKTLELQNNARSEPKRSMNNNDQQQKPYSVPNKELSPAPPQGHSACFDGMRQVHHHGHCAGSVPVYASARSSLKATHGEKSSEAPSPITPRTSLISGQPVTPLPPPKHVHRQLGPAALNGVSGASKSAPTPNIKVHEQHAHVRQASMRHNDLEEGSHGLLKPTPIGRREPLSYNMTVSQAPMNFQGGTGNFNASFHLPSPVVGRRGSAPYTMGTPHAHMNLQSPGNLNAGFHLPSPVVGRRGSASYTMVTPQAPFNLQVSPGNFNTSFHLPSPVVGRRGSASYTIATPQAPMNLQGSWGNLNASFHLPSPAVGQKGLPSYGMSNPTPSPRLSGGVSPGQQTQVPGSATPRRKAPPASPFKWLRRGSMNNAVRRNSNSEKPHFTREDLECKSIKELKGLLPVGDRYRPVDKTDLVNHLIAIGALGLISSYKLTTLRSMSGAQLRRCLADAEVSYDSRYVVEKEDMIRVFYASGKLRIIPEQE